MRRPGTASIFIPKDGTVQEWITSADEIKNLMWELKGSTIRLSTSSKRNELFFISWEGIMKESNSMLKSENSYDQYHWCPIILTVIEGEKDSSSI